MVGASFLQTRREKGEAAALKQLAKDLPDVDYDISVYDIKNTYEGAEKPTEQMFALKVSGQKINYNTSGTEDYADDQYFDYN